MAAGVTPKKIRKLADSTGNEDDCREYVTETLSTLQEIDKYQNEIEILCNQANKEMIEVERKYSKLKKAHFEKRNSLIGKIPHFWVTAFVNHPDLNAMLDDTEEDCLHYLTKLQVEEAEDITSGYRISFHFDENPYFENAVLSKEFNLGTPDFPSSQSTTIKWKEGFDLSQKVDVSVSKKGKKHCAEQKSFFAWFNDHVDPISDDIAEVIKDDLWVNPLNYYLVPDIEIENAGEEDDNSECENENNGDAESVDLQSAEGAEQGKDEV